MLILLTYALGAAQASTISGLINTSAAFSPTNQSSDSVTYFNAPSFGPFPGAAVAIGEFDFSIPSTDSIVAATITGHFGSDSLGSGTSQLSLFLNGVALASCDAACSINSETADVAWSYTFTAPQLSSLLSGQAILSAVQRSASQMVLDPTSISIQTAPVPLPATLWLLGSGLLSLFGIRRR